MRSLYTLKDVDLQAKGTTFDSDCAALVSYYEDTARRLTVSSLAALGMGIRGHLRPLEVSLVRWVVDQLAVAYTSAPTRWLVRSDGSDVGEDTPDQKVVTSVLSESMYDEVWREIDRMRALLRQCVVRAYPIDDLKRVELRVFGPHQIRRSPSASVGHTLDLDSEFALQLSEDLWEHWYRSGDAWACRWTRESGSEVAGSPYSGVDRVPYDYLPVQIIYDTHPCGRPYLTPRGHRLSAIEAINALSNELLAMIRTQGHSQRVFIGVDARDLPAERGPGVDLALDNPTSSAVDLSPSPKISESLEVLRHQIRMLLVSENLPIDALEVSPGSTPTGAALKQQLRGLFERRKTLSALAPMAERDLYRRFRSVHNAHASSWGVPSLPEYDIRVELAPWDVPVDAREEVEVASREMAIGTASRVDVVGRMRNVPRHAAIALIEQIDDDIENYPTPVAVVAEQSGPRTSTVPDAVLDTPGATSDSVVNTLRNESEIEDDV